jgi:hypothetical protein
MKASGAGTRVLFEARAKKHPVLFSMSAILILCKVKEYKSPKRNHHKKSYNKSQDVNIIVKPNVISAKLEYFFMFSRFINNLTTLIKKKYRE